MLGIIAQAKNIPKTKGNEIPLLILPPNLKKKRNPKKTLMIVDIILMKLIIFH